MAVTAPPRADRRRLAIPSPRRFPVGLAAPTSVAVALTSFGSVPAWAAVPGTVVWLALLAFGALSPRRGVAALTALAVAVKPITISLAVWALTHPHSGLGPHDALDWVPLGSLNCATGLWLLRVIRHRAG